MYYRETFINGVLMFKNTPNGEWREVSKEVLTERLLMATQKVKTLTDENR